MSQIGVREGRSPRQACRKESLCSGTGADYTRFADLRAIGRGGAFAGYSGFTALVAGIGAVFWGWVHASSRDKVVDVRRLGVCLGVLMWLAPAPARADVPPEPVVPEGWDQHPPPQPVAPPEKELPVALWMVAAVVACGGLWTLRRGPHVVRV